MQGHSSSTTNADLTIAGLFERLGSFDGPPEEFLASLLAFQCQSASADGGAILRAAPGAGRLDVLAIYPPVPRGAPAPPWLGRATESAANALNSGRTTVAPLHAPQDLYGQPAQRYVLLVPLKSGRRDGVRGLAAFAVEARSPAALAACQERLESTTGFLSLYETRLTMQRQRLDLQRLRMAMETLAVVSERTRFAAVAMALCNEIATRWKCERVGLGFLKGRYVHLKAMSHTEKFSRKMKVVQDIEAAMEECLDQDLEVLHPAETDAVYVSRAAAELARRHGPTAVISLPLRHAEKVEAVLTLERAADRPFMMEEVEALRLTADLCTPHVINLHEQDRWFGAKAAAQLRKALAWAVGSRHTWAKVAAILAMAGLLFIFLAQGDHQAEAPFVLETVEKQVIPAPFDGFLQTVAVVPGDPVKADQTVLATLDVAELRLQLAAARAEQAGYLKQVAAAMREGKTSDAQVAQADADRVAAQIELFEYRIARAEIRSPIDGVVTAGDLKRQIGAPVKTGDVLFEVAPVDSLRAELAVPEDQVADVQMGQEGDLAVVGYPERKIQFVVERVSPVAEVVDQQNVFKVRVKLNETQPWMRPGMEGVAKVNIGRRTYAWLWTHRMVDWVRMKLWL